MERNNIVCSHTDLSDKGTNTHSVIDAHINTQEIHQTGGLNVRVDILDGDGKSIHSITFTNGVATEYTIS